MVKLTPDEYSEMIQKYSIEYHSKLDEQKSICVKNGYDYDKTQCKKIKEDLKSIKLNFKDVAENIGDNINSLSSSIIVSIIQMIYKNIITIVSICNICIG